MDHGFAVVKDTVPAFWTDVDRLPLQHRYRFAFHLKRGSALQDVEHLLRALVVMQLLGSAGWHAFLDYAQAVGAQEVPAVALVAPGIVLGVSGRGDEFIHGFFVRIAVADCAGRGYTRRFVTARSILPVVPFAG